MSAVATVSSPVSSPLTTSSSFMRWTGLKKCMPTTFCGRRVTAASSEIESAEVLEASTAAGGVARSSAANIATLSSSRSGAASTTRSASRAASSSVRAVARRRRAATASASGTLPVAVPFSNSAVISATACSIAPSLVSWSTVRKPPRAET